MPESLHTGHLLAGRYRLDDLLSESEGGRFWRAHDQVLHRAVAIHLIPKADARAEGLMDAARRTAPHHDRRILRVLDADEADDCCYVVNEWGQGTSLDAMLATTGPLQPRRAAWVVSEIADSLARAHDAGLDHGRMVPENVLIDLNGEVRIIGFAVDAALHGLPPGRAPADLIDTTAVLYAAMTGKWAGSSSSTLPAAPTEQGQVLRPRRVRAGIPRPLDDLCDQVINAGDGNQRSAADPITMAGIAEALLEFVGDPAGLAGPESWPEQQGVSQETTAWTAAEPSSQARTQAPTPTPEIPDTSGATAATTPATALIPTPVTEPVTASVTGPAPTAQPVEMPTQAGIPVFDENNTVGWIQTRSEAPPPPPPLEDTESKPLFAPDPVDGRPARRPRPGSSAAQPREYWPWDSTGTHTGTSSAVLPPSGSSAIDDDVPGRRWFRLALWIGLGALALVAVAAFYQFGVGKDEGSNPAAGSTSTGTPTPVEPTPFPDLQAIDFDPQGSPPQEENRDLVPLSLDGDPATAWHTSTYTQPFPRPTGLKDGVGLQIDLGATKGVREIDVATLGGPTDLAVYVNAKAPTGIADLTPVGTASGEGTLTVTLGEAVSGRYVTVWLTSLPPVEGGYQGAIAELSVKG